MRNIICIYPKVESTDFLMPVYEQLKQFANFSDYRFNTTEMTSTEKLYNELKQINNDSLLFFLGHGASNKLYGSIIDDNSFLFNHQNTKHLKEFDIVCVACRSKEFAHNHFKNYIGFGNITSDYQEILDERDSDYNYMSWADEEDIANFRTSFVNILVEAIKLSKCSDLNNLYRMLKLCFNKEIANLLMDKKINHYRELSDMLFDIENEMEYCKVI